MTVIENCKEVFVFLLISSKSYYLEAFRLFCQMRWNRYVIFKLSFYRLTLA